MKALILGDFQQEISNILKLIVMNPGASQFKVKNATKEAQEKRHYFQYRAKVRSDDENGF